MRKIPYANLGQQAQDIKSELMAKVEKVLLSGHYILGPEVSQFEDSFAAYCGSQFSVGVANGTSALYLVLQAWGIQPGDEVITAPNSFIATASVIALLGAKPVFVDISPDLNIDPHQIEAAITSRTKAIIPVHLTGRLAHMPEIMDVAKKYDLLVLEDAAQSVGASFEGKRAGSWGHATGFSLHPLKNLHAFGDAGIICTDDEKLKLLLQKLRSLGFRNRETCEMWAFNERLDELQAALLNVQLQYLDTWTESRRKKAFLYNESLQEHVTVPQERAGEFCVYQTYVIQAPRRDALMRHLQDRGIDSKIHYPVPIHLQECAKSLGYTAHDFPTTMKAASEIMSLPLYPELCSDDQNWIIDSIRSFYES